MPRLRTTANELKEGRGDSDGREPAEYVLRDWHVIRRVSPTHGIEREYVVGAIYGCPGRADGTYIMTTAVLRIDGDCALTVSGVRYRLERRAERDDA